MTIPRELTVNKPKHDVWHPSNILKAFERLPQKIQNSWLWWDIPEPTGRNLALEHLIEMEPTGTRWHTPKQTADLLSMMNEKHLEKVERAKSKARLTVGCIYKRTRMENGEKIQRAEIRFDGVSGCLRTPAGGSSRQILLFLNDDSIRSRLISTVEAARLMGVPDRYELPKKYNDAYHLLGDGLVVPLVSFLEKNIISRVLDEKKEQGESG